MAREDFSYQAHDGKQIFAYKWEAKKPKAAVQIVHGAIEHAKRYDAFAQALADQGFSVYANDHRGHGKTAQGVGNAGHFSDKKGGVKLVIEDLRTFSNLIRKENPDLPVFLFGHSMGSFLSKMYVSSGAESFDGLLLTGSGRTNPVLLGIVRFIAKAQMILLGRKHRSPLLQSVMFGTLNRPFGSSRGCEFISTDQSVVDAYYADEFCGNTISADYAFELLYSIRQSARVKTFAAIPADLSFFIGAGEFDTMGGKNLSAVKKNVAQLSKQHEVTFKVYQNMRHEILNEKDKQVVYNEIIEWMGARI